jgi:hypothetical protein
MRITQESDREYCSAMPMIVDRIPYPHSLEVIIGTTKKPCDEIMKELGSCLCQRRMELEALRDQYTYLREAIG